ncbi:ras-related protein Rab-34 [Cotesia glomerata]|uniref:ras-related protein Rab-34 n=1 Tax=Cotesia glomerata TaxID=32391 RepID=UPI001D02749F|nr:ras-related protein Rab-34 [Cotesia glomerata]
MLETRSAVYKMLQPSASEERRIVKWPPPYSMTMTPYQERDFDVTVRRACLSVSSAPRISKLIVLGDVAVGKTSLVNVFCHKKYNNNYKPTIGVDFEVERFDILNVPFNLQIWDTAGQERFKAIAASYYRGANIIMLVFDLTSLLSLSHCKQWLEEAARSNTGNYFVFLVGTKRDLMSTQVYEIVEKRAITIAESLKAEYWSVSSKTNDGITELFSRIAALSFSAAIIRELNSTKQEQKIGTNLITLKRHEPEIEKKSKFIKWPSCFN